MKRRLIQRQRADQTQDPNQNPDQIQSQNLKIQKQLRMLLLLKEPPVQNLNQKNKQLPRIKVLNTKAMNTQQPVSVALRNEAQLNDKIG